MHVELTEHGTKRRRKEFKQENSLTVVTVSITMMCTCTCTCGKVQTYWSINMGDNEILYLFNSKINPKMLETASTETPATKATFDGLSR